MGNATDMPIQTVRETLHLLGYLNARYGRPERAIGYFELMTVVDAMNPTAWRTLATIQLALEKNPEASASAAKALEIGLPPDEASLCHLVKAIAARRLGNTSESDTETLEFLKSRHKQGGAL
jgi:hypothetical protein